MSSSHVDILMDMGFSKDNALRALEVTGNQGVEPAMEWLLAHSDEMSSAPETTSATPGTGPTEKATDSTDTPAEEKSGEAEQVAKSLKCDECGKLFKSEDEVEYHAAKTNHVSFSESTEEKRPLTEEEKREQLRRLEEKMRQKRIEREEKEKKEALDREKNRIKSGKEMIAAKKKMEEEEMKKLVEQRKREKIEEKLARDRVKQQIEQDKIARRAKFGMAQPSEEACPTQPTPVPAPAVTSTSQPPKDYSETRLQIRLANGDVLTQTFGSKEQLSAVRLYIEMNRTDGHTPFSLMTTFPRKVFAAEDYEKPLDVLGLVPSAVVIVSKPAPAAPVF